MVSHNASLMRNTMTSDPNSTISQERVIPSDTSVGLEIQEEIIAAAEASEFSARDIFSLRLALSEGITNAIRHGNRMSPDKQVEIQWTITADKIRVVIRDEGEGFNPDDIIDPTEEENLERPGGRGVMLMKSFMDQVLYNEKGNQLTLEKQRSTE